MAFNPGFNAGQQAAQQAAQRAAQIAAQQARQAAQQAAVASQQAAQRAAAQQAAFVSQQAAQRAATAATQRSNQKAGTTRDSSKPKTQVTQSGNWGRVMLCSFLADILGFLLGRAILHSVTSGTSLLLCLALSSCAAVFLDRLFSVRYPPPRPLATALGAALAPGLVLLSQIAGR